MDSKDDDISSLASGFSAISFRGNEEVSAEVAVDESIKSIQDGLNGCQVRLRMLLMADERGDSYSEMEPLYNEIMDLLKEFTELTKEIKSICKQIMPAKPKATKKDKPAGVLDCCG